MASKSKNRKSQSTRNQRRQRKEQKRKHRKSRESNASNTSLIARKHQQKIAGLQPRSWAGEPVYDVAVFDEDIRATLAEADQVSVSAVATALDLHAAGQPEEAQQCLVNISRKSPMSDWRMLIRGLSQCENNNLDAAVNLWSRLDENRRPARIARVLQLSHRDDLATLNASKCCDTTAVAATDDQCGLVPDAEDHSIDPPLFDNSQLQAAKVVRKICIDRSAIKLARKGLAENREFGFDIDDDTLPISPAQIAWLKEFARSFRQTEPDLVRALELLALERAHQQPFVDIFDAAVKSFRGPVHDPNNTLRCHFYHAASLPPTSKAESYLRRYRKTELNSNQLVSVPLRNALLSELALTIAEATEQALQWLDDPINFDVFPPVPDGAKATIRTEFCKSIEAYPQNSQAHEGYSNWIKNQIDTTENDKSLLKQLQQEQLTAMQAWASGVPTEERPRLFLAESFLQGNQPELAEPHIQWLLASRPSDLRICAMPWSLQLHKLMQLCRRKSNLSVAHEQLNQVLSQWPEWLSPGWQPYLTAAWLLRSERHEEYEQLRGSICNTNTYARNSAPDACMMLAAAQKFHVPAANLKPLRQAVDECLENLSDTSADEIVAVGSFFWSLCQVGIRYPAMRYHQTPLGRMLLYRLSEVTDLPEAIERNSATQGALLWTAEQRFWSKNPGLQTPGKFIECIEESVPVAAAFLRAFTKTPGRLRFDETVHNAIAFLNKSYRSVPEPFYRQWYSELLAECEVEKRLYQSRIEEVRARRSRFNDNDCPCPECIAQRMQAEFEATPFDMPAPEISMPPEDPFSKPQQSELF